MGTLALTQSGPARRPGVLSYSGDIRLVAGTFTFSSSYTTGGETLDLVASYPNTVKSVIMIDTPGATTGGHVIVWNATTKKLMAFWTGAGLSAALAEVTNATNLSGLGALPFIAYVR